MLKCRIFLLHKKLMWKYSLCSGQGFFFFSEGSRNKGRLCLKCASSARTSCDESLWEAVIEIGAWGGK